MATVKVKRGLESNLGAIVLQDGEFAFTTDTQKLYVGLAGAKILLVNTQTSGDMSKGIYDTDLDGVVDRAELADKLTTTRNIALTGDVTGNVNFDGTGNVSITSTVVDDSHTHDTRYYTESEIQTGSISMRNPYMNASGVPTSNLGSPNLAEMALFEEQFNNKSAFYDITKLSFQTSPDGVVWTDFVVSDSVKQNFIGGDNGTTINIPYGTVHFRITLRCTSYVYLNALYTYWSSNGHSSKVKVYKKHDLGSYTAHANSETLVSAWPGHLYLPFSTIPFHPSGTNGTHYHEVYIVFTPTWNATYPSNNISLNKFQLWGGYPAGKRNLYSVDSLKNVAFPAELRASKFLDSSGVEVSLSSHLHDDRYLRKYVSLTWGNLQGLNTWNAMMGI